VGNREVRTAATLVLVSERLEYECGSSTNTLNKTDRNHFRLPQRLSQFERVRFKWPERKTQIKKHSLSTQTATLSTKQIITTFVYHNIYHSLNEIAQRRNQVSLRWLFEMPLIVKQRGDNLMTECSLFSHNRPAVLRKLHPHLIHTVSVSNFLSNNLHSLIE
jgi:hypothetical protein